MGGPVSRVQQQVASYGKLDLRWGLRTGLWGGLLAGAVFLAFELVASALLQGPGAMLTPLRMIGGIVWGTDALDASTGRTGPVLAGLAAHVVLAPLFGLLFGLVVAAAPVLLRSASWTVVAASAYGFVLWVVNFYLAAPLFGWHWFPQHTVGFAQFLAHTFFYGTVLGLYFNHAGRWRPTFSRHV